MDALQAIGDPVRRRMVELLSREELSAGELSRDVEQEFGISQPAASRHLRVLREVGLVSSRVDAQSRVYALEPAAVDELAAWTDGIRRFWRQRLDALGTELTRGRRSHDRS
jgi:DNA-binding transcriptional ArsR family regulator